jgi:hypothetical protein
MKPDIDWDEVAKVELRPDAPDRPDVAVKAIAKHAPMPHKAKPTRKPKRAS